MIQHRIPFFCLWFWRYVKRRVLPANRGGKRTIWIIDSRVARICCAAVWEDSCRERLNLNPFFFFKSYGFRPETVNLRLRQHVNERQVNPALWTRTETPIIIQSKSDQFSTFDFRLAHQFPISFQSKSEVRKRVRKRLEQRCLASILYRSPPRFLRSRSWTHLETWETRFDVKSKFSHAFLMQVRLFGCFAVSCERYASIVRAILTGSLWIKRWCWRVGSTVRIVRLSTVKLRTYHLVAGQLCGSKRVYKKIKSFFVLRGSEVPNYPAA
jgi:hypothetical protein